MLFLGVAAIVVISVTAVLLLLLFILFSALHYHDLVRFARRKGWFGEKIEKKDGGVETKSADEKLETIKDESGRAAGGNSVRPITTPTLQNTHASRQSKSAIVTLMQNPPPPSAKEIIEISDRASMDHSISDLGLEPEKRGFDNPPPMIHYTRHLVRQPHHKNDSGGRMVTPLDPDQAAPLDALMSQTKMRVAANRESRQKSSLGSVDPTQMSTTRASPCLTDRAIRMSSMTWKTSRANDVPQPTSDLALKDVTSIRHTSGSVSSRHKYSSHLGDQLASSQPIIVSPLMESTQQESERVSSKHSKQRPQPIHLPQEQSLHIEGGSVKTDIPEGDGAMCTTRRLGAGREQGVWMSDEMEEESYSYSDDDEDGEEDRSRKVPQHLVIGLEKELFYDSTFLASSVTCDHPSSPPSSSTRRESLDTSKRVSSPEDPPTMPLSLHESDLEAPRFSHIKQILSDSRPHPTTPIVTSTHSPITWALSPPSGLCLVGSDVRDVSFRIETRHQQHRLEQQHQPSRNRSKCFEYKIDSSDKLHPIDQLDSVTNSPQVMAAILHGSPVFDESNRDNNEQKRVKNDFNTSPSNSSSFHSAVESDEVFHLNPSLLNIKDNY